MSRLADALAILERLDPDAPQRVQANLDGFAPDAAELVLGYAFADILSRPALNLRSREMLTVAMLAAMATAPGQLQFHIRAALNCGVTRAEIIEIILQVSVYAGVPACMNAITAAKAAFAGADE
ncbi:MAG: carboxymuconolactone decarboxylase family protein [Paracoccus sp. (in: a-proteobacteria)]|uniref:carboxymuconolactone decarboxylase family protein n=1 Tax=Paracoccus sp. TaxID=267 RepID=UPI0026DEA60B|nr:carboxymuconolactone decarboxylase family protein [Paracoccus sp. (in: a-proteobacteria)]MDO5612906.1 carboxymuconolactone decarboxylase family protein [Paracoccus sp. (in: a-proteobacteria)]